MDASTTINGRRLQPPAGYVIIEGITELCAAGWRGLSKLATAFSAYQRRAQARDELRRLSDRSLKDIGLERSEIDRLFR